MILAEADLVAAVTRDRAAGKRVGFIPLAFDLLKVQEVRAVQAAAETSDRLVVAIVDDDRRHVIEVKERAELVNSLRGVDYVLICADSDVERLRTLL